MVIPVKTGIHFFCYHADMLIGIEASRAAGRLMKTGVEWYAWHVIQGMKALPEALEHSFLLYGNMPLAQGLEKGPDNWHEARLGWPPKYLWTQIRLSWEMSRRPPDVLFVPAHVLPRVAPKRSVVTIHDVGFHRHPELYKPIQVRYHEWATRDIVKRAARILTVSEFSKREIVEAYGADPSRIRVTLLGVDHDRYRPAPHEEVDAVLRRLRIPQPYVLFIGRLERKKNVGVLVDAFTRYKQSRGLGDPLRLVLVGFPGTGFDALEKQIVESPARDAILLPGYVREDDKPALLTGAEALIHPSWYEGFGIPPLEAMACGCPVLCSRAASLPEVVGEEQALWFDPANADELAERLREIRGDVSLYQRLRDHGLSWVRRYTWDATARQTLDALTKW